jgi:hypothetical protein
MNLLRIACVAFCSMLATSHGEMVFASELVEIQVQPDENEVTGEFPFEIKGSEETILSYDALCTCLAGRVEPLLPDRSAKLHWKPGEKGVIKARFDTSKFLGTVDKAIELKLKGRDPVHLTVRVHIPQLVELDPNTLKWEKGGERDEKIVKIKINHSKPIHITSHSATNKEVYPYELKTVKEGWEYEIRVKPTTTTESGLGMISLRTDCEIAKFKRAIVYVVTKPKLKGRPAAGEVK